MGETDDADLLCFSHLIPSFINELVCCWFQLFHIVRSNLISARGWFPLSCRSQVAQTAGHSHGAQIFRARCCIVFLRASGESPAVCDCHVNIIEMGRWAPQISLPHTLMDFLSLGNVQAGENRGKPLYFLLLCEKANCPWNQRWNTY